jgi:membrane protein implicated in regulation of membrane protease activity
MLIYAAIGAFGLIVLLALLLVGDFGGDHDVGHDVAHDVDHDGGGPSIFSVRVMAAFLTAFGVGGVVGRYYGLSHPASSGIGIVAGVAMATIVYQFARVLYSQQASSEVQMTGLVGAAADVTVAIPAQGVGQIAVSARGERSEHIARSADGGAIARGTAVRVTSVGGDSVIVVPAKSGSGGGGL